MPFQKVCVQTLLSVVCYLVHVDSPGGIHSYKYLSEIPENAILYPTSSQRRFKWNEKPVNKCPPSEAYDVYDKKCYRLTSQGPCRLREWWVLDERDDAPVCQKRPCKQFLAKSPKDGRCVIMFNADKLGICQPGNKLYHDDYGLPRCDCKTNHYIWSDGNCYPAYQRGPCSEGYHVRYNDKIKQAECQKNPCEEDNLVAWNGQCLSLGDLCDDLGQKHIYINPSTGELGCYDFFRLPNSPQNDCHIGTMAHSQGRC